MKFDFVLKIDLQIQKGLWSIRPVSGQKSINSSISRLGVLISKLKKRKQEREKKKKNKKKKKKKKSPGNSGGQWM